MIIAAGGTGLAPVKSVINYFYANQGLLKDFDILSGFKTSSDILFKNDLDQWAQVFRVEVTVDKADDVETDLTVNPLTKTHSWPSKLGLITNLIPDLLIPSLDDTRVIIVGPPIHDEIHCSRSLTQGYRERELSGFPLNARCLVAWANAGIVRLMKPMSV